VRKLTLKHTFAALSCTAALVASLTACSNGDAKSSLPLHTGGSSPSTAATSRPTTSATAATKAPAALALHSINTYGGLKFVVDLPSGIPSASLPDMRTFSAFLQGVGHTTANNKFDPSVSDLASPNVVKIVRATVGPVSAGGIGSVTYTINTVHKIPHGPTVVFGCLDQSKLVQVRKDGTQFIDANTREFPKLRMEASIRPDSVVTNFSFDDKPCG
jgi:hypothetical protein